MTKKVSTTSESIFNENLAKLQAVFPNFVRDGQVDFDALQAFLKKDGVLADGEKYGLSWAGKSNAFRAIRTPSTGTLVPQREESKNWDNTENLFIEGDNLEVLKLLQKHYREKIKMIYIDPPYNTGKDFVYKDNFTQGVADYYEQTGQTKGGIKMTTNTEKNGRYHSDWLTMMYPRLFLARNLLKDDGVIFVSIDDNEVANLRLIMDEIFGEENFVAQIIWRGGKRNAAKYISTSHEYILFYSKNMDFISENNVQWKVRKSGLEEIYKQAEKLKKELGENFEEISLRMKEWFDNMPESNPIKQSEHYQKLDERGLYYFDNISRVGGGTYDIISPLTGNKVRKPSRGWVFGKEEDFWRAYKDGIIVFSPDDSLPSIKRYLHESENQLLDTVFYKDRRAASISFRQLMGDEIFDFPKDIDVLKYFFDAVTNKEGDIVLDFFAGSATTAHAVMDLNADDDGSRRWICVQLPEATEEDSEAYKAGYKTIAEISRERIRRAGDKIGKGDIGFKSYKLSRSNYRQWQNLTDENDEEDLKKQAKLFMEKPLVDNYKDVNVVYEILIKEGFDLNSPFEPMSNFDGFKYYRVTDISSGKKLYITFVDKVSQKQVEELGLSPDDTFVCFDSALDDTGKVNVGRVVNVKII